MMTKTTLIRGHLLDAPAFGDIRSIAEGALVIEDGRIAAVGEADSVLSDPRWKNNPTHEFPDGTYPVIVPGLIDVHAHIPQYPAVARPEEELLPWLNRHIFPLEKEFRGEKVRPVVEAFFRELAANGTTTAMLYGAVWEDSTDLAFEAAKASGIRAIIGKVMMDVNSYGWLHDGDGPDVSITQTRMLCRKWHGAADGRLEYAVSPRFAVTCSAELMKAAAETATEFGAYIQTHLSENHSEIKRVAELFPESRNYTDVYRSCGLLTSKTVLGHCLHLGDEEIRMLAESGSKIAHCPTSNFFLNSGLFPLERLRDARIAIGLGSDVAGGPELNLWQVMRSAVEVQKARRFSNETIPELTATQAFYLATQGGAEVLGKEHLIGTLDSGKEADIAVFDLNRTIPYGGRLTAASKSDPDGDALAALLVYRGGPNALLESRGRGKVLPH